MQNNPIEIKLATETNAEVIALLARITFSNTFGHYFRDQNDLTAYLDKTFSVSKIKHSISKPTTRYWLIYVNALPVGYAKLKLGSPSPFVDLEGVCQLQKIYILKDFHGMKLGFQLQTELLETAAQLGHKNIWLSVLDDNIKAINFYKNTGFTAVGTHDFQIGKESFNFNVLSKVL